MDISTSSKIEGIETFETAINRLEEIVQTLDEGKLTLDETLTLYEEGIGLYRFCNNKLEKAEQRISVIMNEDEDSTRLIDFEDFKGE